MHRTVIAIGSALVAMAAPAIASEIAGEREGSKDIAAALAQLMREAEGARLSDIRAGRRRDGAIVVCGVLAGKAPMPFSMVLDRAGKIATALIASDLENAHPVLRDCTDAGLRPWPLAPNMTDN